MCCLLLNRKAGRDKILYIQMRPKKRRKPYLPYLWLDLNETITEINIFFVRHCQNLRIFSYVNGF
jgi:hypothetical protein